MKAFLEKHRGIVLIFLAGIVLALAFPLQGVVQKMIIAPAMRLGWLLGILYRSIQQFWLWSGLMVVIFFITFLSFTNIPPPRWRIRRQEKPEPGPIKALAEKIQKKDQGIYFKWRLANRIGFMVRDWLAYQGRHEKKWRANSLDSRGWQPDEAIHQYLIVGLKGSFADYSISRIPFRKLPPTPLDIDPNLALDYLESHMEAASGQTPK